MDTYNNMQAQQSNSYENGQPQYSPYGNGQPQYNPYGNGQSQYNPYVDGQPQYNANGNMYPQYNTQANSYNQPVSKKKLFNLSAILGLVGSIIIFIGLMLPIIDFSHFHQEVDIQYNLFKVGKNVGLISAMWNVIPYAILIGVILLAVLAFIKIPILKILPVVLILCMFILMLADMGNVASWVSDLLERLDIVLEKDITIGEIFKGLMPGVYIMIVGIVVSLVSCFVKIKDN